MFLYLVVVAAVVAWRLVPRPWKPALVIETSHYRIESTAAPRKTEEIGRLAEGLYLAYSNLFQDFPTVRQPHGKLKLRLYRDRAEFRRTNPGIGWAEAFYHRGLCQAYFSEAEVNPYHWMLHEAVHQLNHEVAHLNLEKWLDEGLSEYFSTRRIRNDTPLPGTIDPNTYPVWWSDEIAVSGDLAADLKSGSVIPLRAIVIDRGGPSLNKSFNLYYLHWWTLTHFLFETPKHRAVCLELVRGGGKLEAFERLIGPVDEVQRDWYAHVGRIKAKLSGADLKRKSPNQKPVGASTNAPVAP